MLHSAITLFFHELNTLQVLKTFLQENREANGRGHSGRDERKRSEQSRGKTHLSNHEIYLEFCFVFYSFLLLVALKLAAF